MLHSLIIIAWLMCERERTSRLFLRKPVSHFHLWVQNCICAGVWPRASIVWRESVVFFSDIRSDPFRRDRMKSAHLFSPSTSTNVIRFGRIWRQSDRWRRSSLACAISGSLPPRSKRSLSIKQILCLQIRLHGWWMQRSTTPHPLTWISSL